MRGFLGVSNDLVHFPIFICYHHQFKLIKDSNIATKCMIS